MQKSILNCQSRIVNIKNTNITVTLGSGVRRVSDSKIYPKIPLQSNIVYLNGANSNFDFVLRFYVQLNTK